MQNSKRFLRNACHFCAPSRNCKLSHHNLEILCHIKTQYSDWKPRAFSLKITTNLVCDFVQVPSRHWTSVSPCFQILSYST